MAPKSSRSNKKISVDIPFWFSNILMNRGIDNKENIFNYLNPSYEILEDNSFYSGIDEAIFKIKEAKEKNKKILVYGDYDVDGITATAILHESLNKIGVQNIETYIPHREDEGYGLNEEALLEIELKSIDLVITVDCGITSSELIKKHKKLDFIVIDHHAIDSKKLPRGATIIHPELRKDKKDLVDGDKLAAGGMAFIFAMELQKEFKDIWPSGQEKWLLDLASLATICDIVPLTGRNRIIATWGLRVLAKTKRTGILALAKISNIDLASVSAYDVGFILGPRLNAAGRIDHAKLALELLITESDSRAKEIAIKLDELNRERQEMCEKIINEAKEEIERGTQKEHKIYLLSSKNWPRGVVGIVASRISDEHHRPVIIFENDGERHHGSARSIDGFNIVEALGSCEDCIEKFGGHARAAGLTVPKEKFVLFSDKLIEIANSKIKESDLMKTLEIDTEINFSEINEEALDLINKMEPTGFGNSKPIFVLKSVLVGNVSRVGKGKEHLKFKIIDDLGGPSKEISGIAFSEERNLKEGNRYDLAGTLRYNIWNNRKSIEFRMIDFCSSKNTN